MDTHIKIKAIEKKCVLLSLLIHPHTIPNLYGFRTFVRNNIGPHWLI